VISVFIGLYFSPIGWSLAAALTAIMITGMAWRWIAVPVTHCELRPESEAVHEDTPRRMLLRVCNQIPISAWGLVIESYLDCHASDESKPTVGYRCVSLITQST
jgi:hypothetical protein